MDECGPNPPPGDGGGLCRGKAPGELAVGVAEWPSGRSEPTVFDVSGMNSRSTANLTKNCVSAES